MKTLLLRKTVWNILPLIFVLVMVGCDEEENNNQQTNNNPPPQTQAPAPSNNDNNNNDNQDPVPEAAPAKVYKTVDRLARPAIAEGLVVSPEFLDIINSVPPAAELSDAAAPIRAQIVAVLNAVDGLDGVDNVDPLAIADAFLPDVMRIDTEELFIGSAYGSAASPQRGILLGGRKLKDDVVDITLGALVGSPVSDNVDYDTKVPGNPSVGQHKPIMDKFPYAPAPN